MHLILCTNLSFLILNLLKYKTRYIIYLYIFIYYKDLFVGDCEFYMLFCFNFMDKFRICSPKNDLVVISKISQNLGQLFKIFGGKVRMISL